MMDRAEPDTLVMPVASRSEPRDPLWLRGAVWLLVAVYLLAMGAWAYRAGMQIRDDAWANTKSIRFHGDIANGVHWGSLVLRSAERAANAKTRNTPTGSRVVARAAPTPGNKNQRPLTFWEIVRGEDQVYQDFVLTQSTEGDFGLDYPPMRLMAMTLWTRYEANRIPGYQNWPGPRELEYSATADPAALMDENVAHPMLLGNAYSIAAGAVFAFFLVWVWVYRGGRPSLPGRVTGWKSLFLPEKQLVPWKPQSLRQSSGLVVFPLAAWAFFYAVVIAENPAPAPPPSITWMGRPVLSKTAKGDCTATLTATINGQGDAAQWHVDWGSSTIYDHQTPAETIDDEQDVGAKLNNLSPGSTIHYRFTARNERGETHTDDAIFNTADALPPRPPAGSYGTVWLSWTHWTGIAILFGVMACSIKFMPPTHRGWAAGLVAALFLWLDPSVIMDTHVWPQWDAWVLPPFLLAVLLASLDWWLFAGIVMGVGVMFKGQTMVGAPLLALWPLLSGRWGALGRMVTGFILAAGLVLSPWLVLNNGPVDWSVGPLRWIPCVLAAAVIAGALSFYRRPAMRRAAALWEELKEEWHGRPAPATQTRTLQTSVVDLSIFCGSLLAGIVCITILVLRRWPVDSDLPRVNGLFLLLGILIPPWFLPRRSMGVWLAALLGCSLWMSAYLYHGDWAWKTVGFEYGARKHNTMALGQGAMGNLPEILASRFGWDIHDTAMTFHPPDIATPLHLGQATSSGIKAGWVHDWGLDGTPVEVDIRQFLMGVFAVLMLLTGAAAAMQSRRNDPRLLAAISSVWLLMPNVLCQMAARYQVWGAAMSSILIAISPGLAILHIVVALLAAGMVAAQLLNYDASRSPLIHDIMVRFHPDDGWIMLTIALVFLYVALTPGRRPPSQELQLP